MSEAPEGVGREVLFEMVDEHIALCTLNRPEKRNAVNGVVAAALEYLVRKIEADDRIWVAIIASSSEGFFCAGADLGVIAGGPGGSPATPEGGFGGFADAKKEKAWIAAVTGPALAGGCELALAADMIVAGTNARFGLPEVKRGLFAGAGGVHRMPRALPRNVALELVATGDPLPADRAYQLGLVNYLVEPGEVLDKAKELARAIARNAPLSVRESLKIARISAEHSDAELRRISAAAARICFSSEDAKEGPRAFLEKREAKWLGR